MQLYTETFAATVVRKDSFPRAKHAEVTRTSSGTFVENARSGSPAVISIGGVVRNQDMIRDPKRRRSYDAIRLFKHHDARSFTTLSE